MTGRTRLALLVLTALGAGLAFASMTGAAAPPEKSPFVPAGSPYAEAIARMRKLYERDHALPAAEEEGKRLLSQIETSLGPDAPETLEIRGLLVHILMERSKKRVPEAVAIAERALSSAERIYGHDDPRLSQPGQDLGDALGYLGSFVEARDIHLRMLRIQEASKGPQDPAVAAALGILGYDSRQLGDFVTARLYLERALAINEARGDKTSGLAMNLTSLASVCRLEKDLEAARAFAERSVRILEALDDPLSYLALDTLADIYRDLGRYEDALDLEERCVGHLLKEYGPSSGSLPSLLTSESLTLSAMGQHERARDLAERALEMQSNNVPPDDRTLILFLRSLSTALANAGNDSAALPPMERAVRIMKVAYGPKHVALAPMLADLSRLEYRLGRDEAALEHALEGEAVAREAFQIQARILSERQAYLYETNRATGLQVALSVLSRGSSTASSAAPARSDLVSRAWDDVVRSRALVLDEMNGRHRAAWLEGSEAAALAQDLLKAKSRLAALVLLGPDADGDARLDPIRQAQERKEALERDLARRSATYRQQVERWEAGLDTVRSALPPGGALLAYVEFDRLPPAKVGEAPAPPERHYGAFVLAASSTEPAFFPLGPARDIEPLVVAWRKRAGETPLAAGSRTGPSAPPTSTEDEYRKDAGRLRETIWDPVSAALRGARMVFVVPDGALQLVNLATLPAPDGRYLVEAGPLIHYLSTERDLSRHAGKRYAAGGALILGGPDLDAEPTAALAGVRSDGSRPPAGAEAHAPAPPAYRSPQPGCEDFRALRFDPIDASRREVSDVKSIFGASADVVELTGAAATESAFKALAPGRRLLHIATHGFFLQDRCESALDAARRRGAVAGVPGQVPSAVLGDNPLLLSGLALAGSNRRGAAGTAADADDGILTAEEVGSLDLDGVEWAVLSACETGVGKVLPGEGVLGLRRAFAVAGAGTLIMSLWRVEDEATRVWMKALYQARRAELSTAESVREATLSMIRESRRRGRTTHPFFWGAFVAEGDWR